MCYVHFMIRFIPFGIGYLWLLVCVRRTDVGSCALIGRLQVAGVFEYSCMTLCNTSHHLSGTSTERAREEGTHNDNVLINLCFCARQVKTENHSVCNINWINDKTHRFTSIVTMMIGFVLIGDRVIVCEWAKSVIRCKHFVQGKLDIIMRLVIWVVATGRVPIPHKKKNN